MARRSSNAGGIVVVGFLAVIVAMCRGGGGGSADPSTPTATPLGHSSPVTSLVETPAPLEPVPETQYVSTSSLNQRSAPDGGVVGRLNGGEQVSVYERKGNWVRISPEGSSPRWVSSTLLCSGAGCYHASPSRSSSRPSSSARPTRGNFTEGSCPCSGSRVCVGPRGGRYCITSGGNKRYGV